MNYIEPLLGTLTETYDDVVYEKEYYKPTVSLANVTDEAHADWNVATVYNVGDYVIVPALKTIYRNTLASNTGNYPPANLDKWVDYGVVNSYAMFASDENIGSKTVGTDMVLELDFSKANAIVGIDLQFGTADILLFDDSTINYLGDYAGGTTYAIDDAVVYGGALYSSLVAGNIGNQPDISPTQWSLRTDLTYYDQTILGKDIGALDFATYYYTDATIKRRVILTGLEWLPSGKMRISITGDASIGTLTYGKLSELGCTMYGTKLSYQSSSLFTTNPYTGFRKVTREGKVRILDVNVLFDTNDFNVISPQVEGIIDKNIVWIPTDLDKFSEFITLGYIENFDLPVDNPSKIKTTTRIIGVNK